ncbi:uracil-DNA glycosylase [Sarracenia purpurea var. burkii]
MGFVKLEQLLVETTWLEAMPGELQKPYAKELCNFVQSEILGDSCSKGQSSAVPIYPPLHLIFNALNTTPFDRVKVVIIGQDPYHGPGQAMGLAFSVPEGIKVPSSLLNIYKELHQDLCCSVPSHGNLERWAVQGVLLLNAVLTGCSVAQCCSYWSIPVNTFRLSPKGANPNSFPHFFMIVIREHQANSHAKKGWEQFTDAVIKAISLKKKDVVFLLWGNYAHAKSR